MPSPVKPCELNLSDKRVPGSKRGALVLSRPLFFAAHSRNGVCKRLAVFAVFSSFFFLACHASSGGIPYGAFLSMIEDAQWDALLQTDIAEIERTARNNPDAAFYAAYLIEEKIPPVDPDSETAAEDAARAREIIVTLYTNALQNDAARDGAAERLRPYALQSRKTALETAGVAPDTPALRTLKAASLLTLGDYRAVAGIYRDGTLSEGGGETAAWDRAILLLARLLQNAHDPENDLGAETLGFFLAGGTGPAGRWLWDEITRRGIVPFHEAGASAAAGLFYAADYAYAEALAAFRSSFGRDERLFFRYPALMNGLGRAWLSNGNYEEGAALFLGWETEAAGWETEAAGREARAAAEDPAALRDFRYLCLYYAGRMRRATGRRELAAEHFRRAVALAPDALQEDACIWYIIEMGFSQRTGTGIELLEEWADRWHDGDYFADHYDRVAQWAASTGNWSTLLSLFPAVERGSSGLTRAKYAYLIGRALEEGLISARASGIAANRTPEAFYAIAAGEDAAPYYAAETHLYYRALAGLKLGREPDFIEKPYEIEPSPVVTPEGRFLEGFFTYGAAAYAPAWIRAAAGTLPLPELRELGRRLSEERLWGETIRLCVAYMKRPDFAVTAADIALAFPRGYAEAVTRFAAICRIDPSVLYGLVRTESSFIPDIISRAGAGGLAQLMPETALGTARTIAAQGGPDYAADGAVDRTDPEANLHIGAYYLRSLLDTQETPLHALLAYNGGPTRVRRWARASRLPPDLFMESVELKETREYGKKVVGSAILYHYFYFSLKSTPFVADILSE
jgi:soluble lytic murein transglycosylase